MLLHRLLCLCALLLWSGAAPAQKEQPPPLAERLTPGVLAVVFPEGGELGAEEGEPPAIAVRRDGAVVGYIFSTWDVVRAPGYSVTPFDVVAGVDVNGRITGAHVISHREPYLTNFPEREALVVRHQGLRYSWKELAEAVDRHARALLALGLESGDRLGIWAPNCAEWCITQFASAKIGAILVNINPAYRSSELEYALKQSGCRWVICADAFKTSDYHAMLLGLVPELAAAEPGALSSEKLPELLGLKAADPSKSN